MNGITSDSIGQSRTPVSKAERSRGGNLISDLSQELDRIRSQSRKDYAQTPTGRILGYPSGRLTDQLTPSGADRSFSKQFERKPYLDDDLGSKKKPLADLVPVTKIYELQDALIDINNYDFDNTPST